MISRHILSVVLLLVLSLCTNGFQTAPIAVNPAFVMLKSSAEKIRESAEREEVVAPFPPVIQSIADERMIYNMHVGKAMDTLRQDYQDILTKKPDFDIYDKDISVIDPSGVQLTGLEMYKSAFAFFQTFCSFWFHVRRCSGGSGIQFRMMYDFARCSVRISWNAVLIPKIPGLMPLHVDGISYYQLDRTTGKIVEHKIENLMINNTPVAPPYGIFMLLQQDLMRMRSPQGVPAGVGLSGGFQ